ncbi:MAG: DUF4416 family protein, partial [Candidatus Omnitrophica bacterium]|nr:DUF4416 family protein [Candidatus Omnitrophota bacterium]
YYTEEMGSDLKRRMVSFKELLTIEKAHWVKLRTDAIERRYMVDDKRSVNLDPGYLNEAKLVLFTTKDYSHRIYLGDRIFAENTLFFQNGGFRSYSWTYPDYASTRVRGFFGKIRKRYRVDIKNRHGGRA